jgi:hypothetical protein
MKEEYIIGWLDHQKLIMDKEILNLEIWVEESKEDVKKAKDALSGFEYRLEEAKTIRSYMDELEKQVNLNLDS